MPQADTNENVSLLLWKIIANRAFSLEIGKTLLIYCMNHMNKYVALLIRHCFLVLNRNIILLMFNALWKK